MLWLIAAIAVYVHLQGRVERLEQQVRFVMGSGVGAQAAALTQPAPSRRLAPATYMASRRRVRRSNEVMTLGLALLPVGAAGLVTLYLEWGPGLMAVWVAMIGASVAVSILLPKRLAPRLPSCPECDGSGRSFVCEQCGLFLG